MFRRLISISVVSLQMAVTFAVLFVVYMVFAVLDGGEADLIHWAGLFLIQPLIAAVVSSLTILVCYLVGLPIRLNEKLHDWWRSRPLIPITGGIIGVILLLLSFNVNFAETVMVEMDAEEVTKQIPNTTMILTGWFLIAFSSLHFYPGWRRGISSS